MIIYPLSLAIYCTSWTFFGSVGLASRTGFDFLTIYVGPIIMIGLASPLIAHIVRLAKTQNITSIADFIAARYGKHQAVAATVALIAIVGSIPYIALQLKAVSSSLGTILTHLDVTTGMRAAGARRHRAVRRARDGGLRGAVRHAPYRRDRASGRPDPGDRDRIADQADRLRGRRRVRHLRACSTGRWRCSPRRWSSRAPPPRSPASRCGARCITMTLLSTVAIVLLPRQFHVTVVENHSEAEVRRAAWLFPLYLVLINLFVIPIAVAGLLTFPPGSVDSDMFVLALPLSAGSELLALTAFVGGLSAATAMVIVETVALAIMASNDIVVPLVLQRREAILSGREDVGAILLTVRRLAIFVILLFAYMYYRSAGDAQLASIGLLSFAAVAQLAPAFFGGLIWRRGTARGALAGMTVGILVWAYTLMLPSFADAGLVGKDILTLGPFGIAVAAPAAPARARASAAGARRALEPVAQHARLSWRSRSRARRARSSGCRRTSSRRPSARRCAELPALAFLGDGRGADRDGRALSRRGAHLVGVRELRGEPPHQPRSQARSRHPPAALRRASPRLGDRRGLLAPRAVAAAAQAHRLDQGRAQAARRRQCGDPVQPRDPADRARSRAPGHRGVRQGPAAGLLEPAVRRDPRPAAGAHPRRRRARRDPAPQRRAGRARAGPRRRPRARAHHALSLRREADPGALRRARAGGRDPRQPHAGRRHRHHLDRHHAERRGRRGAGARQREPRAARQASAPRS